MQARAGRGPRGGRRRPGTRVLAAALAAALTLVGCGSTPAPVGPSLPPVAPSASPDVETAPDRCALLDRVMQSLEDLRLVRLRPANRDILGRIVETVRIDWDDVRGDLPGALAEEVAETSRALVELEIAMLDYLTAPDPARAAEHVLESELGMDRAVLALRTRTACPPFVPAVVASPSPEPTPTAPPVPDPTPFPSLPVRSPAAAP